MFSIDENHMSQAMTMQDVDATLRRVAEIGRALHWKRNSFIPINALPLELLSDIFLYLQASSLAVFNPIYFREWCSVLHVCQHWRSVAHSCPLLWKKVDVSAHPELVEELLRRSRNAGLELKMTLSRTSLRTLGNWNAIVLHSRRIRVLHLRLDGRACDQLLNRALLEVDMPRLESLRIHSASYTSLHLSSRLFSKGAPCLRHLELADSFISWNMPLLLSCPHLKTLIIRNVPPPSTIEPILNILQATPLLEGLNMSYSPLGTPAPSPPLGLEHLRSLIVSETASEVFHFIKNKSPTPFLAPSTSDSTHDADDQPSELPALFEAVFNNNQGIPFTDLHINTDALSCEMRPSRNVPSRGSSLSLAYASLQETVHMQALIDLITPLPLKHLTSFTLEDHRAICGREALRALLQAMPHVQTLHVYHKASMTVFDCLCTDAESGADKLLLPHLEHLILEKVTMNRIAGHASTLMRLQEMQFLRSHSGRPITELTITACRAVTAEEIRVLCHLFVDVHWDRLEFAGIDAADDSSDEEAVDDTDEEPELWEMWEGGNIGWHS